MTNKPVRTRFAPSPTGFLHVGGVRTALFAWLIARQGHGQFILRIEDTDKVREVEGSERHIQESLSWLGLEWDEGPDKGGAYGPYRQSERLDIYREWAEKLIAAGRAYADPYSKQQLEKFRSQAKAAKKSFLFRDHRPANPPHWDGSMPLRFKSEPQPYVWHDAVLGDLKTGPEAVDDFILIKSDGYPTYNFAHIVDDHLMRITHVIRSQEFTASVPKFLNLYEALKIERPVLATLPYVMGPDGKKKLSKRDGAKDILDYKKEGYLPGALVSFLATLGWNDGTTQEIYTIPELIEKFSLDRVQKSGARFDEQRLKWINGKLIRTLDLDKEVDRNLLESYIDPLVPTGAHYYKQAVKRYLLEEIKAKSRSLSESEIKEQLDSFFNEDYELHPELLLSAAGAIGDPQKVLETIEKELRQSDFTPEDLETRLRSIVTKLGAKPADLFGLIRVAMTGKEIAPGLWNLMAVIGPDKSLARLDKAIEVLRA